MKPNKRLLPILMVLTACLQTGCIGAGLPHPLQWKPWTLLSEGDQFGRDQLANRYMVATRLVPVKGLEENEVLTVLGEPQKINVRVRDTSEDWHFIYYKRYKTWPKTEEGSFVIRFQDKIATEMAVVA